MMTKIARPIGTTPQIFDKNRNRMKDIFGRKMPKYNLIFYSNANMNVDRIDAILAAPVCSPWLLGMVLRYVSTTISLFNAPARNFALFNKNEIDVITSRFI